MGAAMKTIGVIGAGQLGLMLAEEAHKLGARVVTLDPAADAPAARVADGHIVAAYDDGAALEELCRRSDVVTYEFENVPGEVLIPLVERYNIPQGFQPLYDSQDRLREKRNAVAHGLRTPRFAPADDRPSLEAAVREAGGFPCVFKTRTLGYDGHGQVVLRSEEDMAKVEPYFGRPGIVEEFVAFDFEASAIVVGDGRETVCFPVGRNVHRDGILDLSVVPAEIPDALRDRIVSESRRFMQECGYRGILAIEYFVKGDEIYFNEMAPRGFDSIFSGFSSIDDDFYEELEEILIMGDIGINATTSIIENLKKEVSERRIKEPMECKQLLINEIKDQMRVDSTEYEFENRKSVVLVIGVNGVGKTTSVGKLAGKLKDQGKKVVLAAADTFRAAAGEQLTEWAHRAGVEIIGGQAGADPASVIYDAVAAAKARNADVLLCDTAGRLHNKKNLMEELRKIYKILEREYPDAYLETLVVLDGTTGQNALAQARQFAEVANVNGIILTKLDGTAKGGIAVAIQSELDIPVKYIGVGESIDDLQKFDADRKSTRLNSSHT